MSIVINTNVPALMAAHHVRNTRDGLETSMERLASGSRINSAADDAAGAGISMRLMAQIRGADMARRNTEDGVAVLTTADGALIEVANMLARARELAVQKSGSNIYTSTDVAQIDAEITQLNTEIAAIASNTEFNSITLSALELKIVTESDGATTDFTVPTFLTTGGTTVTTIDAAINTLATARGSLASFINRLEFKVNNLSILSANTASAHSRINDTDYAAESANVAKGQVLQQAGAAMLAQANASSQYVLTLLQ